MKTRNDFYGTIQRSGFYLSKLLLILELLRPLTTAQASQCCFGCNGGRCVTVTRSSVSYLFVYVLIIRAVQCILLDTVTQKPRVVLLDKYLFGLKAKTKREFYLFGGKHCSN